MSKVDPALRKRFLVVSAFRTLCFYTVPVVLISQSLVVNETLDMQDYVGYYFFATLAYLALYGVCALVAHLVRKRKA